LLACLLASLLSCFLPSFLPSSPLVFKFVFCLIPICFLLILICVFDPYLFFLIPLPKEDIWTQSTKNILRPQSKELCPKASSPKRHVCFNLICIDMSAANTNSINRIISKICLILIYAFLIFLDCQSSKGPLFTQ
jgi:hypothetical protein